jgi:hypothetical protein
MNSNTDVISRLYSTRTGAGGDESVLRGRGGASQNILTCQSLILRYFRSRAESRFVEEHENSTISRRGVQLVGLGRGTYQYLL